MGPAILLIGTLVFFFSQFEGRENEVVEKQTKRNRVHLGGYDQQRGCVSPFQLCVENGIHTNKISLPSRSCNDFLAGAMLTTPDNKAGAYTFHNAALCFFFGA
jgi:hypothetical protein